MAGNDVQIKITGDDREVLQVWQRQNAEILKNQRNLQRLGTTGQKAGQKTKGGFDSALGTLGKFTGAIAGVGGVVGGVSLAARQLYVEFQRIKELQQTDADKQVEFEHTIVQAVRNAGGLFDGAEIKDIALGLEKETGVAPVKIAEAISSALSARGATNKGQAQEAIDATRASLKFAPELSAENSAFVAGAGIDISKRFGFDPEESIGFLQNVGSLARVTDLNSLAQNVAPAVNNLSQFGNTGQEAGSLVSAITQGVGDFTGRMSGTAAVQLAKQIRDRGIGDSTSSGIELLQNDEKLRKKFLEGGVFDGKKFPKASFEAKADPTIRDLLTKGSFISKSFKEGIEKIGNARDAQATFNKTVSENEKITRTSRLQRQSASAADTANIKDQAGADAAVTRQALSGALDAANFSDIRKKALTLEFEAKTLAGQHDPLQVAEAILEREQKRLLATKQDVFDRPVGEFATGGKREIERVVTDEDRQSAKVLKRQEEIFERFIAEQKQGQEIIAKATEENTKALKENSRKNQAQQPAGNSAGTQQRKPYQVPAAALSAGGGR